MEEMNVKRVFVKGDEYFLVVGTTASGATLCENLATGEFEVYTSHYSYINTKLQDWNYWYTQLPEWVKAATIAVTQRL